MSEIKQILKKAEDSVEINTEEALTLLKLTGKDFTALQQVSDRICYEKKDNLVTFVVNRKILLKLRKWGAQRFVFKEG
ncbi:MAG: hypothetical protein ACTSQU_07310 [Promethearchaeota archaeon]